MRVAIGRGTYGVYKGCFKPIFRPIFVTYLAYMVTQFKRMMKALFTWEGKRVGVMGRRAWGEKVMKREGWDLGNARGGDMTVILFVQFYSVC